MSLLLLLRGSSTTNALFSTLTDDFSASDVVKWTYVGTTVTGGKLSIPRDGTYSYAAVNTAYDIRDSQVVMEVAHTFSAGGDEAQMILKDRISGTSTNELNFSVSDSLIYFQDKASGVLTAPSITYDSVAHRWWRIKHTTASGVEWATSPDGITWTTQRTSVTSAAIGSLYLIATADNYNAVATGTDTFDNLNLAPSQPLGVDPWSALVA